MTTDENNATPLVNCLQQALYQGQSGAAGAGGSAPPTTTGTEGAAPSTATALKTSGWWAFQYDPSNPTLLTMLVTLTTEQTEDGCLTFYSSQLSVDEVQSLYQWLALHMNQQKASSSSKPVS